MAGPISKIEVFTNLAQKSISGQLNKVVRLLVDRGKIAYTLPEKPPSRLQKYRLTEKGQAAAASSDSDTEAE